MPRTCSVGLCKNNSNTVGLRFFKFPNNESYPERRKLWAARCNRKKPNGENWEPNPNVRNVYVCSEHFVSGEHWNHKSHPDYAPCLKLNGAVGELQKEAALRCLRRFTSSLERSLGGPVNVTKSAQINCHDETCNKDGNIVDSVETFETADENSKLQGTECSSLQDLKSAIMDCNINLCSFLPVYSNTLLTFIQVTDSVNTAMKLSVVVDDNFHVHIHVFGCEVPRNHQVLCDIPATASSAASVALLLNIVAQFSVCNALDPTSFSTTLSVSRLSNSCIDVNKRLRADSCYLLVRSGELCVPCKMLRKRASIQSARALRLLNGKDLRYRRQNNSSLSSPVKLQKLRMLARQKKRLSTSVGYFKSQLQLYREKCSSMIAANSVNLNEADNNEITNLAKECQHSALQLFPEGSFQRIFWEQQIKYNKLKNKCSMRWHPVIIRWCLYLKNKSAAAYDGMRSYISLPSERTLYDYSHYMEGGLKVRPTVVEQLIEQAKKLGCFDEEHKSFVGLLHDEIKVKSDLIFNKNTGELLGYVNLDNVSNELLQLDNAVSGERQLAQNILVVMVRGITTSLRYPLASFSSSCMSGCSLFSILWECVQYVEVIANLKVLYICCDGAVQNRLCFKMMEQSDEMPYMATNPYATDREIFFVCDPPHLLKTARNCFSNSQAHTKSRELWFDKLISWKHVVDLYEQHCVKSEYRVCPKLTRDHLYLNAFSRMRVSLAAQVLSSTVANALEHFYGDVCSSTVRFIRMMNKWFDLVNVRNFKESHNTRNPDLAPFTDLNDPRLNWLESDFPNYLDEWQAAVTARPGNFTTLQRNKMMLSAQTLLGFKITCQSIPNIVRILLAAGAPFVLTNHLNQDPLEQLFGHCRHKGGANNNPTIAEACNSISLMRTVSTQAIGKKRGNTEKSKHELDFSAVPKRRK